VRYLPRLLVLLVALAVAGVVAVVLGTFLGRKSSPAEAELPGQVRLLADGHVNLYLLQVGEEEVVLFDCGQDPAATVIKAELVRRRLGPDAVKAIFLTHGHPDHVGGCRQFPGARVHAFAGDRGLVEGTEAAGGPVGAILGRARPDLAVEVSDELADGGAVEVGGATIRAFALPGHTAGSGAFLVNGVLLLGDAASATSEGGVRGAEWIFSSDRGGSNAALVELAGRLEPEVAEVRALAFSHSGPLDSLEPLLDFARAR
jgi:glyoxylase-like metal-dependent hydrolase (beta-lactamase superfamily II)